MVFFIDFEPIEKFQKALIKRNVIHIIKEVHNLDDAMIDPKDLMCGLSLVDHYILSCTICVKTSRGVLIPNNLALWYEQFHQSIVAVFKELGIMGHLKSSNKYQFQKEEILYGLAKYLIKPYFDVASEKFIDRAWKPGGALSVKGWEYCCGSSPSI